MKNWLALLVFVSLKWHVNSKYFLLQLVATKNSDGSLFYCKVPAAQFKKHSKLKYQAFS
jgi:hypothetical protein